jgi:hypothetical protein
VSLTLILLIIELMTPLYSQGEYVWNLDQTKKTFLHMSCDVEGHLGHDKRYYIIGTLIHLIHLIDWLIDWLIDPFTFISNFYLPFVVAYFVGLNVYRYSACYASRITYWGVDSFIIHQTNHTHTYIYAFINFLSFNIFLVCKHTNESSLVVYSLVVDVLFYVWFIFLSI